MTMNACGPSAPSVTTVPALPEAQAAILGHSAVLFGHQSVGGNILDGVARVAGRCVALTMSRNAPLRVPGIRHFYAGNNGDPLGKIADFDAALAAAPPGSVDIAVLKFCFVDITAQTDGHALAEAYVAAYDRWRERYPQVRFVAVTAPLTAVDAWSLRSIVRRLLGRAPSGFEANVRRRDFNEVLRAHFKGAELFDLSLLESTALGAASSVELNGVRVATLDPRLTDDGGHLNTRGQDLAAAEFLRTLAARAESR